MARRRSTIERQINTDMTIAEAADVFASLNGLALGSLTAAFQGQAAVVEPLLGQLGAVVYEKRHKMVAKGYYVPPRFLAADQPTDVDPGKLSKAELLDVFRGPWEEFQKELQASGR